MEQNEVRRHINKQFSIRGHSLSKDALSYLVDQLKDMGREQYQKTMAKVMELIGKENVQSGLLDLHVLKNVLRVLSRQRKNESEVNFKLENAFELLVSKESTSDVHLGTDVYWKRFDLVKKLLTRNHSTEDDVFVSIDSIFNLRGTKIIILAQLCRGDGTGFVAEDQTARIKLDLSAATYEPGIYFEGGIFVFEGVCSLTTLKVEKVSLPKLKGINSEESTSQQQDARLSRRRDPNDRICVFSDLLLDNDKVLKAFYRILDGFSSNPPNVFVLCGRFLSVQRAYGYTDQSSTAFRHLTNILSHFSTIYLNSVGTPPLSPSVQNCFKDLPNVHFASNPCRLIFKDRHFLIIRDDVVEKICRSAIHMPKDVHAEMIPKLFCDTMWSQRHLSPLPLFYNSIQPETDQLFHLWPEPDVLLLADKFKGFIEEETDQRRLTINPGPFLAENFEFQVYFPTLGRVDNSVFVLDNN
uniref:DNA polymerase II subunit 2 n=1 Tax=Meloidogyne hapla TaxID=6305 RepID=A0A1I8B243_MELHA